MRRTQHASTQESSQWNAAKNNLRKKRMRQLHLFPDSVSTLECTVNTHPLIVSIITGPSICPEHLQGPSAVYKKLDEYTKDEVQNFPEIVRVPHL